MRLFPGETNDRFIPALSRLEDSESLPLGAADSFLAAYDAFRKTSGALGADQLRSRYEAALQALADEHPNDPEISRALIPDPSMVSGLRSEDMAARLDRWEPQIRAMKARGLPVQTRLEAWAETHFEALETEQRAAGARGLPAFLGTAAAAMTDPVNLATLPLGAARGATFLTKVLAQAGVNAATEGVIQVGQTGPYRRSIGLEWSPGEAAYQTAAAAAGGAFFEGVGLGVARAYRAARSAGRLSGDHVADAAASVVEDAAEAMGRNPLPGVDGSARAHLAALSEAMDSVAAGRLPARGLADHYDATLAAATAREAEISAQLGENAAAIGRPGGETFKTADEAEKYARKAGIEGYEIVERPGAFRAERRRGSYVVRLKMTPEQARVAAAFDFAGIPDDVPGRVAAGIAPDSPPMRAVEEAREATGDADLSATDALDYWRGQATGDGRVADDLLPEDDSAVLASVDDLDRSMAAYETDRGAIIRDGEGSARARSLGRVLDEADEDVAAVADIRACVLGGGGV